MTRTYNEKIRCPECGHDHTPETDFERWMRRSELLDSQKGLVRFDLDVLLHRYKFEVDGKGDRTIQCMMFVEVKTYLAKPSAAQTDTISLLNQVLRNRRQNIHSTPRRQIGNQVTKAHSKLLARDIAIRLYGGHLLQMDGSSPDNSKSLLWDYVTISNQQLIDLLLFNNDPDCPTRKLDHRRRSRPWNSLPLLDFDHN